jgi:hypothetical protein
MDDVKFAETVENGCGVKYIISVFCLDTLNETIERYGAPKVLQQESGQSVYKRGVYVHFELVLAKNCMDSKGRALDKIFFERL